MRTVIIFVCLCFLSACSSNRVVIKPPPEGYTIYTDGISFRWSDDLGLDLTSYYSKEEAVEAAWGSYIIARKYGGVEGGWRIVDLE